MSSFDTKKLIEHLQKQWMGKTCPMCGIGPWSVSDSVFELRTYQQGNFVVGAGPIVPVIPVTCQNCGNTIFVNALVAKVVDREPHSPAPATGKAKK